MYLLDGWAEGMLAGGKPERSRAMHGLVVLDKPAGVTSHGALVTSTFVTT